MALQLQKRMVNDGSDVYLGSVDPQVFSAMQILSDDPNAVASSSLESQAQPRAPPLSELFEQESVFP